MGGHGDAVRPQRGARVSPAEQPAQPEEHDLSRPLDAIRHLLAQRAAQGFSVVALELESGVSANTAYAWAKGIRDPRLSNFVAFANALGFDVVLRQRAAERI